MKTFNNYSTGIAVMIEEISGGYGGHLLTHVCFDTDGRDGIYGENQVIEVRKYPAGKLGAAIEYAKLCTADTVPARTFVQI